MVDSVEPNSLAEDQALLALVKQREESLRSLERELDATRRVLKSLRSQQPNYELLRNACSSLQDLDSAGASDLLWRDQDPTDYLRNARRQIDKYEEATQRAERRQEELLASIGNEGLRLEYLRLDLAEARERAELRANEWVPEREPGVFARNDNRRLRHQDPSKSRRQKKKLPSLSQSRTPTRRQKKLRSKGTYPM
jgi:hypothetical protein